MVLGSTHVLKMEEIIMQELDECSMREAGEAIIIPVGMSPVHSLRLMKSLSDGGFDLMVLAVSEQTEKTGELVLELIGDLKAKSEMIHYSDAKNLVLGCPEIKKWNLFIGPGTRSMPVTLWGDLVNSLGESPTIWVDYRRKTKKGKGKPIEGERIVNLDNKDEFYKIQNIDEIDACAIYGINLEDFGDLGELTWNTTSSIFTYHVRVPKDAVGYSATKARKWEERVVKKVKILRDKIGRHALRITRSRVPSKPRYWIRVSERLEDFGIKGGVK